MHNRHEPQLSVFDYFKLINAHEVIKGKQSEIALYFMLTNDINYLFAGAILEEAHDVIHHQMDHHSQDAKATLTTLDNMLQDRIDEDMTQRNNARYNHPQATAAQTGLFSSSRSTSPTASLSSSSEYFYNASGSNASSSDDYSNSYATDDEYDNSPSCRRQ